MNFTFQVQAQEHFRFQFVDEDSVELPLVELYILKKGEKVIDTLSSMDGIFECKSSNLVDKRKTKIFVFYASSYSEIIRLKDIKGSEMIKIVVRRIPDKYWWIDEGNDVATCHDKRQSRKVAKILKMIKMHNRE